MNFYELSPQKGEKTDVHLTSNHRIAQPALKLDKMSYTHIKNRSVYPVLL